MIYCTLRGTLVRIMSIYPVYFSRFWDKNEPEYWDMKDLIKHIVCHHCGGKISWRYAYGHHSVPWGCGDVWCCKKCFEKWRKT